jgi:hypothetical protein
MVLLDPICQLQNHPEEGIALRDVGEVEVEQLPSSTVIWWS